MCCSEHTLKLVQLREYKLVDPEAEKRLCHCPPCLIKREHLKNAEPWRGTKNFLTKVVIVFGWLILIFLAYKVSQFDYEMANFDPYEILGISPGSSQAEVKKAYRRLSLILHPDKDTGNEKEFMKLSKAYQVILSKTFLVTLLFLMAYFRL